MSFFLWQVPAKTILSPSSQQHPQQLTVRIKPTEIKINGDSFQARAASVSNQQTYQVMYRLKSADEKKQALALNKYVVIKGLFDLREADFKRNKGMFDYKKYLKQQKISQLADLKSIQAIYLDDGHNPWEFLTLFRVRLDQYISASFGLTTASYMKSLLLGMKDDQFFKSQNVLGQLGIRHFFSISGFHLFFFLNSIHYLYLRLGGLKNYLLGVDTVFLILFAILTGFSTSVGRSTIYMWLLTCNKHFGERLTALDCWSLTLLSCLVVNPYLLLQAGGQLSFGLTFCILFLKPIVSSISSRLKRSCYFSLVISIFSIPLIAYNFFEWHALSLLLTLILVPIFSWFLMPVLTAMLVLKPVVSLGYWETLFEKLLVNFDAALMGLLKHSPGHFVTGQLPISILIVCGLLIIYWLAELHKDKYKGIFLLCCLLVIPSSFKYLNPVGTASFVDVGQGDCFLLSLPFNRGAMMIDVGGQRKYARDKWQSKRQVSSKADYDTLPLLKSFGITQLDQVFITHGHEDHFGDLQRLSQTIKIKKVIFPNGAEKSDGLKKQLTYIRHHGTQLEGTLAPNRWLINQHLVTGLYPFRRGDGGNNNSLVLTFKIKNRQFLMTGDLEKEGEAELLAYTKDIHADILKIGHHGSKTSTTELFLEAVSPKEVIISCGVNNTFGHPNEEVLQRLEAHHLRIHRTDQEGMIYYQWYPWSRKLMVGKTMHESD